MEMGHFQALPDVVAVAADRLVAIVRVDLDGSVVVRDLANGVLRTTSASELRAPASLAAPTETTLTSIALATDAQWERARRREAVVAGLTNASNVGNQVASVAARLGVSRRTVFRYLAAYRASHRHRRCCHAPAARPPALTASTGGSSSLLLKSFETST
jgi:hypothetical protein